MQCSSLLQYSSSHGTASCRLTAASSLALTCVQGPAHACIRPKPLPHSVSCLAHALPHMHGVHKDVELPYNPCSGLSSCSILLNPGLLQSLNGSGKNQRCSTAAAAAAGSSQGGLPQQPQPPSIVPPAQFNPSSLQNLDPNNIDPNGLAGLFMAYAMQLQQAMSQEQQQATAGSTGGNVLVKNIGFHPPGAEQALLSDVSFHLKPNQLGLIIGRSGSGKTTLLQLLAGLSEQTSGQIYIHRPTADSHASGLLVPTHIEERMQQVGLVFQFPERHFLGDDVMAEMTFTWPRDMAYWSQRQAMAVRMQRVVEAVGLTEIPFNISPTALSGGQQRRLALALQLVRAPSVLLLDEPLAGLDWHARREVVSLLRELKKEATLLVVSHDLADIAPLVDCAWKMQMGGQLEAVQWPPDSLSDMED